MPLALSGAITSDNLRKFYENKIGKTKCIYIPNVIDSLPDKRSKLTNKNIIIHKTRLYMLYIQPWIKLFFQRNNNAVLLHHDPDALMKDLILFLGLPEYQFNTTLKFNISGNIRFKWLKKQIKQLKLAAKARRILPIPVYQFLRDSAEKIFFKRSATLPQQARVKLQDFYDDDVRKLEVLIQRDLTSWRNNLS